MEINPDELYLIGDSLLQSKGLVDHHLQSADDLYEIGIPQIITKVFDSPIRLDDIKRATDDEKNIDHVIINLVFSNVVIHKPTMLNYNSGKEEILMPNLALIKEKTYKSNLSVDVKIIATAHLKNKQIIVREDFIKGFKICKVPIMVKSKWCNTYNLSKEALVRLHEDPSDPGGYFIIKGVEWVIDGVENILFNKVRIFRNEGYKKEIMRAEFISKPGDYYLNSDQFILRWLNDGQITIEIRSEKLKEIYIPFYIVFRMLGWTNDKKIFDNILYGYDSPSSKNMMQFLEDAFSAKYSYLPNARYIYTQGEVLQYFAEEISEDSYAYLDVKNNPENYQKITNSLLDFLDIRFLQHIGSDISARERKMRFLANIIRKIFMVKLGNMETTDRDSYNSKRVHAAGTNYAKSFKTHFNSSVIQQIKRKLSKDFKALSFHQIDLAASVKSSVYGAEFERAITTAITVGNKSQITISRRQHTIRLSSQLLNRKNQLNTFSTLRQVTVISSDSSKQSERAVEMRKVHLSALGYICVVHSPEGEKVGINKQLAIFAGITRAQSSEVIKALILEDPDIYVLNSIDWIDIARDNLSNVYVNGDWIGCCKNALALAEKYRNKRRRFEISPEITIAWDNTQDELYFWTDVGRVIRPLIIVYNSRKNPEKFTAEELKSGKFIQKTLVTQEIIDQLFAKAITFDDLLKANVVEYISAEEQENMYLSPSYNRLHENRFNELHEYTHCDIPQAILGLTALTSPYAQHNQSQRIVYQTSQSKQTGGVFAKNWPYRADKDTFLQYVNEMPLVKTLSNRYLYPNGSNCIVALMCNTGFNQEDSIIMSKGATDRGLFNGCKFVFYKTELEQREEFANPDITTTIDIKSACYDKLFNGIISKGTIVHKNDAIIGKVHKLSKGADETYQYVDRSVIYQEEEPAIVSNVIIDRNEEDERFCKVVLRKLRVSTIGDKFSVRPTSQVLTDYGWLEIQYLDITKHKVATLTKDGALDYVYPTGLSKYEYDGEMYSLKTQQLEMFVTKNHKLYVKKPTAFSDAEQFQLLTTDQVIGKNFQFKKWAKNKQPDINYFDIDTAEKFQLSQIFEIFRKDAVNDEYWDNKRLPEYIWKLSQMACAILLTSLINNCGNENYDFMGTSQYFTKNADLADDIQRLALHSGKTANIDKRLDCYIVYISDKTNFIEPTTYSIFGEQQTEEQYVPYKGLVYCLEIPDSHIHVYYSRESKLSPPYFTGNSARSGQKSTIGTLLSDEDMPSTEDGIKPTLIMNPMSYPSRMTIGQLIECLTANICTERSAFVDATMFKETNVDSIALELENLGLHKYGYKRLYNGITGEYIDSLIFMGPTYYQRLQKFTLDTEYSIAAGPTDILTRQQLDGGKSNRGGLRLGEMEVDVLVSHGNSKFLAEKFFEHSDKYTEYICRCGRAAIVNPAKNIYKCAFCKDNAEIFAVPTSWSSKLFIQELKSMNVGVLRKPEPFTYQKENSKIFEVLE